MLLLGAAAAAQDRRPLHEIHAGENRPVTGAESSEISLRPLDASDPEMKSLVERFFELTPCGARVNGLCEEALSLLREGGDRLAAYLIQQVEANDAEGFPNRGTYLRVLGHTESTTALHYLTNLVESRGRAFEEQGFPAHEPYIAAIEALGRTRSLEASETALAILERSRDPGVQIRAINAFDRAQSKHGVQPAGQARIRAVMAANEERETALGSGLLAGNAIGAGPWADVQRRANAALEWPGQTYP